MKLSKFILLLATLTLFIEPSVADDAARLKKMREALWSTFDANRDVNKSQSSTDQPPSKKVVVEVVKPAESKSKVEKQSATAIKSVAKKETPAAVKAKPAPKLRASWDAKNKKITYASGMSEMDKLRDLNSLYKKSIIGPGVYHSERSRLKL